MAESMKGLKRTHRCGELSAANAGEKVTVMGWVQKQRNKGGIIFVDLRDRAGILQVIFEEADCGQENFAKAEKLRSEFVVAIVGKVEKRAGAVNENLATGEIEVRAESLRVLSEAETPPFPIETDSRTKEELRLKYRYLDLRRPDLQRNLMLRSRMTAAVHAFLKEEGFLEVETPILNKSTPEGARDYLVPSRIHQGCFYALPQSPQIFKQLLMCSGYDRYFQLARCFRDEDLRANRQPEFSQIDLEMSYVEKDEDVMEIAEGLICEIFNQCLGMDLKVGSFRKIPYAEAMENYGSDKPDTRFDLKIKNLSDAVKDCEFSVFANVIKESGSVRGINAKGLANLTRKQIDALGEFVKGYGVKGLAWVALKPEGTTSSFAKFMTEEQMNNIYSVMGAEQGDLILIIADKTKLVLDTLGGLRCHIADSYNLYDKSQYDFLWVTDFPLLEYDEEEGRYVAVHHPFTSVKAEDIPLLDTDPGKARANAYDFVINGQEAGGGSIRIHNVKMQEKMFTMLGMTEEDIKNRFGFFVDAFKYGAPPHGGLAFGLDRLVMLVTGTDNIKDVIAFPKVQNASCLMSEAPSPVDDIQLKELFLEINKPEN